jgi:hypothetical protein
MQGNKSKGGYVALFASLRFSSLFSSLFSLSNSSSLDFYRDLLFNICGSVFLAVNNFWAGGTIQRFLWIMQ